LTSRFATSTQSQKNTKPEVTDCFQDGRRRHDENSSECYKMGSYHLISTKIGTQTEKSTLSSKSIKAKVHGNFQDGRPGFFENSSAC
jgi:hypothetical protein